MYVWAVGTWVLLIAFLFGPKQYTASTSFLVVWSLVVYCFALRMSRLILLTAPLASVFTGTLLGVPLDCAVDQFFAPGTGAGQKPSSTEGAAKKDDNKKVKATAYRDPAREMVHRLTSMNAANGTLYHSILPLRRIIAVMCIGANGRR